MFEVEMTDDSILDIEQLNKMSFKVDILPKEFPPMGLFIMNNLLFLHVGKQYCLPVSVDNEIIKYPEA
jgi:hypothetical protein